MHDLPNLPDFSHQTSLLCSSVLSSTVECIANRVETRSKAVTDPDDPLIHCLRLSDPYDDLCNT